MKSGNKMCRYGPQDKPPLKGIHVLHTGIVTFNNVNNNLQSDSMTWSTCETRHTFALTRAGHSTSVVNDSTVLVFGGYDSAGKLTNDVVCLDTRMW